MAVIPNATDAYPIESRLSYARTIINPLTWFDPWGLDPAIIDLRTFFGHTADLARVLRTLDGLGALEMCGPEVLSTELLAMSPADAAGVAARAYDELAAELSRDGSKL